MKIKSIKKEVLKNPIPVYDISVKKYHNFCIGDSKIVVHNSSAQGSIIGMAQDFAGSNNLNYLSPNGQFGSRLSSEAAAPRYIFTELHDNYRKIFKKEDDCILNYNLVDGEEIEPEFFIPILPNVLINGAEGMGIGFATKILKYNPAELKTLILNYLKDKKEPKDGYLVPWFTGFKGTVDRNPENKDQVIIKGLLEVKNSTTILISELPVGVYLEKYKALLNRLEDNGFIKSYEDNSTEKEFNFEITCPRSTTALEHQTLLEKFGLITRDSENLNMWLPGKKLHTFDNAWQIVKWFITWRLERYEIRRLKLIELLKEDLEINSEKIKFIEFYLKNSVKISNIKKADFVELLKKEKFLNIDNLINMRIYTLTLDEIEKLKSQNLELNKKLDFYKKTNAKEMYVKELTDLKV